MDLKRRKCRMKGNSWTYIKVIAFKSPSVAAFQSQKLLTKSCMMKTIANGMIITAIAQLTVLKTMGICG